MSIGNPFGYGIDGVWMPARLKGWNHSNQDNLYQYNGKELNNDHGLGWYDYSARYMDPSIGRFINVDPMGDKMPGWNGYNYVMNNPIRLIDPDGMAPETVKPGSQAVLNMIKNTLTKQDAQYVRFDKTGNIDKEFINSRSSKSENFNSLKEMVNSETIVEVSLSTSFISSDENGKLSKTEMQYYPADQYSEFDKSGNTMSGTSTGESGFLGKTLFPDKEGTQNSPNKNVQVIINSKLSEKGRAEMYSHEGNGHARIYVTTNGNRQAASHQTPPTGLRELNTKLKNSILFSKQETIKNMKQN